MQADNQTNNDPRATLIQNVAEDQLILDQAIKQIPLIKNITLDKLLDLFSKCYSIRQEPEFIQAIFNQQKIYNQFVQWILSPLQNLQMIKMKFAQESMNNKSQIVNYQKKYSYDCMRIAKQNEAFFQLLYIKSFQNTSYIEKWFQFLKNDKAETFNTSLGYFSQIMIPFLKYQFSQSSKICDILMELSDAKQLLMSSTQVKREQTQLQKEKKIISLQKKQTYIQEQITILRIFSDQLLAFILQFIYHEGIFKFIHNLILISLEQNDLRRSKFIFQEFLKKALNIKNSQQNITIKKKQKVLSFLEDLQKPQFIDTCIQYFLQILNEIYENANTEKNYRVIFFIDSMVRLQLINSYLERICKSHLLEANQSLQKSILSGSTEQQIASEEQLLENYLKSLSFMIKIYSKMVKNKKSDDEIERQSKFFLIENQQDLNGQNKVLNDFADQIKIIYKKLPQLSALVKKNQSRTLPFSSGQNIKMITLCKYQFFQLIYNCLLLSREDSEKFIVDTDKINIFSIIQKYLSQNRWNNIAHKILEKIAEKLIQDNKNFFRTTQMKKNNMADAFLNSIIQSFTNKNYIFLNSMRFTTQGNIHTLYVIAKAIMNELKESHQLANFIHQFEYYKKFLINDLQNYQNKLLQIKYPCQQDEQKQKPQDSQEDAIKLQVDQLLTIKQIVKKIEKINKWTTRQNKKKHKSTIQRRSLSYISDDHIQTINLHNQHSKIINPSHTNLNHLQNGYLNSDGFDYIGKKFKQVYVSANKTQRDKYASSFYVNFQRQSTKLQFNLQKTVSIQVNDDQPIIQGFLNKFQCDQSSINLNNNKYDVIKDKFINNILQSKKQSQKQIDVKKKTTKNNIDAELRQSQQQDKDQKQGISLPLGSNKKPRKSSSLDHHPERRSQQ